MNVNPVNRQGAAAPGRSNFVTALAWIFIVLSGFAVFISLLQNIMISLFFPAERMQAVMQDPQAQQMPPVFRLIFGNFFLIVRAFLIAALAVLAVSIGLLRRKNWARVAFIAMMVLGVLWNLGGVMLFFTSFPTFPRNTPAETAKNFEQMLSVMRFAMAAMAIALSVLFGWIVRKLASDGVRAEFE